MKTGNYALRYKESSIGFIKFYVKGDTVHVHGPLGWASYIDKDMPLEEARAYWKEKLAEGYVPCDFNEAPRDWWFWN